MSKEQFLHQLAARLRHLPDAERDEILADYRAYFDDALSDGRSETEVAAALGDPERLARELTAERKFQQWENHKTPGNLSQVLVALAGLGVVNLLLALPCLLVLTVLSSLWLGALTMLLAGVLMTGSWASNALFGWPALSYTRMEQTMAGPMMSGGQPGQSAHISISTDDGQRVLINTDASSGQVRVEASNAHGQLLLEKASDGRVARLEARDEQGRVHLENLQTMSHHGVLVVGLVLMVLGALGSFLGWKILSALWRASGYWLRWQWQLVNGAPKDRPV